LVNPRSILIIFGRRILQ